MSFKKIEITSILLGHFESEDILVAHNEYLVAVLCQVSIVNHMLQLCSPTEQSSFPLFSKKDVISSVRIVVDGFCGR